MEGTKESLYMKILNNFIKNMEKKKDNVCRCFAVIFIGMILLFLLSIYLSA